MSRIANALAVFGLAVALAGLSACDPVQNPFGTGPGKAAPLGTSNSFDSSSMPPPSAAGTVAGGTIDSAQSQDLSDYLKHHSLPLVGAQVVTSPSGGKQVILFGFVASDFGKTDAEQKARHYLKDSSLVVDNRIKISPELAGSSGNSGSTVNGVPADNTMPSDGTDPYASSGSVQDYQNNQNSLPPGAAAYQAQGQQIQQYQQYNSSPPSGLTMLLPLLLGGGMTMGTGGYGGSFGGFSSGYAPSYRTYGYPTYPPPMPNSGFGASGVPY
ncbi:hypothetical protein [Candidatus Binatus sp.]|jgi:hypothetical protein|uniref:hypothetical protein n=1 Tax=Candidatus Binatus sp. TaxID=2811406 RepID=UPI003C81B26B